MLQALSQKPKPLAWLFVFALYSELATPLILKAEERPVARRKADERFKISRNPLKPVTTSFPFLKTERIPLLALPVHKSNPGFQSTVAANIKAGPGPGQPEMQTFSSVNNSNMVDLFSGDFSYNIPLMDVGGYPVNLSYRSGITMDQEASWVGLGWNINPGTISRNLRGLPDDFNGNDSIKKTSGIKANKTAGVTVGIDAELTGAPLSVGAQLGLFHNNYRGWGIENGVNASINSGNGAGGGLSGGLSLTNNSQEGVTVTPSFSVKMAMAGSDECSGMVSSFSASLPYNSRTGLKSLQLGVGLTQYKNFGADRGSSSFSSGISFASASYTPSITLPFTSTQYSFTAKLGTEFGVFHPNIFISGYVSEQKIEDADTALMLPAYGYLHYQEGAQDKSSLLDFNREKELTYREKPATPHIAIPIYTYDVFSITGEGTGGVFRGYRGDIGFIHDHYIRTKDNSGRLSIDLGAGNLVHGGVDLNINRSYTQNGPWLNNNIMKDVIKFKKDSGNFEASYFRNPAEKSVNSKQFYEAIGGDDLVSVNLYQAGSSSPTILATNSLTRYKGKQKAGILTLKPGDVVRKERDKRSQVISYLNAQEASVVGLSKYIEDYIPNQFSTDLCNATVSEDEPDAPHGLIAQYFRTKDLSGAVDYTRTETLISHPWGKEHTDIPEELPRLNVGADNFSIRWTGRIKVPVSGTYTFQFITDDGSRMWVNDSLVINNWADHSAGNSDHGGRATTVLRLIAGESYKVKLEYYEGKKNSYIRLLWAYPGHPTLDDVPSAYLYTPFTRDIFNLGNVNKEKRLNAFRKANHISEIDVLNNDGRRYVYGIPVYNLKQREATFAINPTGANNLTGLTKYNSIDNRIENKNGKDNYYSKEEVPAYAHSFLLTGILSSDYVDLTGNGISDDDLGDGIKFNYSKIYGISNPFKWRAPYVEDSITYNEGLKTDNRDDKGNYVYGEKELWFLHSIVSKSMVATFVLDNNRQDVLAISEDGKKLSGMASKRLKEINLYNKADFNARGVSARPIKTVHFSYSYRLCKGINGDQNAGKLTLDSVWFTYNGNEKGKQNPYVFNYSGTNPSYNIKSYDRWGNYKDPLQNPGSVTGNIIDNAEYPYSLQDSTIAAKNASAWSLDSINLPSGGSIKVDFESDDYAYVQNKRAMQLFKLAGLGHDTIMPASSLNKLYEGSNENLYVYVTVPKAVTDKTDAYYKYLSDIKKLYFKLFVQMPSDTYGSGNEYVSCYADLDNTGSFGVINSHTVWIKLSGISLKGDGAGDYSPLAKAAIQFLRLNLPSKAYPLSEVGDDFDLGEAVRMLASMSDNIIGELTSFDQHARDKNWSSQIDLNRSYIRLNSPEYKKMGGGHRVKRIKIYDNWDRMTGQKAALYGQEYSYTTSKEVNGSAINISSGVACYEPGIGNDENPLRVPIEYIEKIAPLGPVALAYSEEPLGESLFPSPGIGYSDVRVRTINYYKKRSANGVEETKFYTAYDFPTITDRTMLDGDTKKRFKPAIANFLKINARHYISLSQGFKVELNDMHGKMRSQASYAETDLVHPIKYTENVYKTQNRLVSPTILANEGITMNEDGTIDTAAIIGKDVELMVDMREQLSITNGYNVSVNADMFSAGVPPWFLIPSLLNLAQREENLYRSAAVLKVVNRFGILDSVIQIDKGSKISTKDLMYDSETGDAILTRTQNEFNDPVYNYNYPAHWAYDGIGMAYKNIGLRAEHVDIREGKIVRGLPVSDIIYFASGDEIFVAGKQQTETATGCDFHPSSFPSYTKIWAVDTSIVNGGPKTIYFIDKDGKPYNGFDITLKIIRSGRRNIAGSVGTITSLVNPLIKNDLTNNYQITFDSTTRIINASAGEFRQLWEVEDVKGSNFSRNCVSRSTTAYSSSGTDVMADIIKAHDNGYILIGTTTGYGGSNTKAYIIKTDKTGAVQWSKTYGGNSTDEFARIKATRDGGFITIGRTNSYGSGYRTVITKMDNNGNVSWSKMLLTGTSFGDIGRDIIELNNGSFAFSGSYNFTEGLADWMVGVVNSAGSLQWFDRLGNSSSDPAIYLLEDSDTLVALGTGAIMGSSPYYDAIIMKLNKYTGVLQDTLRYEITSDNPRNNWCGDIRKIDAGYEFYTFNSTNFDDSSGFGAIHRITYSGDIISSRQLQRHPGVNNASIQVVRSPAGGMLVAQLPFKTFPDFYVQKLNENDSVLWSRKMILTGNNKIINLLENPDQTVAILAKHDSVNLLLLTSSTGETGCQDSVVNQPFSSVGMQRKNILLSEIAALPLRDTSISLTVTARNPVISKINCSVDTCFNSGGCFSLITDTSFNPYRTGVLGNWRQNRTYTYYGSRLESDPSVSTDIRTNGTFLTFDPYWKFNNTVLKADADTARWIWNSEIIRFNQKGLEIENKDPLGRYNAGLYGYGETMPTAVIQNGRYRESAFEGFEDYGYSTLNCDTVCPPSRHIDFSDFKNRFSTTYKHTGKSSLRLNGSGEQAGIALRTVTEGEDSLQASLIFTSKTDACVSNALKDIMVPSSILLPAFSPLRGKKMVISAWVKEEQNCSCTSYTNNHIRVFFGGANEEVFSPAGPIIEGWQRYENVFDIPDTATSIVISLEPMGSTIVYFDDIRIHPFNANMKSFVYNPVDLRLMAELDENNYASFYEYDDDGTLIRVKKETQRGIKTIKETRSALIKQ